MRTLGRLVAFLLAVPLLAAGVTGLSVHGVEERERQAAREKLVKQVPAPLQGAANFAAGTLVPRAAHGTVLGLGGLLLAVALWPGGGGKRRVSKKRKKRKASDAKGGDVEAANESESEVLGPSRKEAKRLRRLAKTMEEEDGPEAAADFLLGEGLPDEALAIFEREDMLERVAEVRHDQNRFEEAASAYERSGRWESAGSIYQQLEDFESGARCYEKAGKLSVAGELYERAENHREAGRCYSEIGFHRQAAQAYLKGGADAKAADSLIATFREEGGGARNDKDQRELVNLAKKAGEILYRLERFDEAEQILVKAGAYGSAAKVAFHTGAYERAAELFQRTGRGDLAAKALEKLDNPTAAARAMGEYLRDKGELEEAVGHLESAGELQDAADIYRQLERFEQSATCYAKAGDHAAAAEMFRAAELPKRAGEAYAKDRQFENAAQCMEAAGEAVLQAQYLEQAGKLFEAGAVFSENGEPDEAIRVLQQLRPEDANYGEVCAQLGTLFNQKGMHNLSLKKFQEATDQRPVSRENVAAYYELAQLQQSSGNLDAAIEIYEAILAFDYHYEDVAERLEAARNGDDQGPGTDPEPRTHAPQAGRYHVVRQIGRGGMGVVHLARDTVLEREVAFKVLPEQLRENPAALKNFLREAKAAAQLNHPNIVTVFDAGESEHGFYLAMELVEGTTLKEIVQRRGAVSAAGVIYILRQMADALAYAHSRKVVHRDIKTANTMWTPGRQVKIMDFGLAKLMEEVRNHTTTVSGTPFYMSPEQTLGQNVDNRTDIYSLGVTLFELATGQLPFRKGNVPYHHVHTPPPPPRSVNDKIPEGLERIVLRCLAKAPDDRYQSAREIIAELDELGALS